MRRRPIAVDLIIFGATGDLSARKLFPALYQLDAAELLQEDLRIAAVGRRSSRWKVFGMTCVENVGLYSRSHGCRGMGALC